ncbi:MAG: hypothetical protein ABIO70_24955 [Pseudomonadota bacterium]
MRPVALLPVLCCGCLATCEEPDPLDTGLPCDADAPPLLVADLQIGPAPWDGVRAELEPNACGLPVLTGGEPRALRRQDGTLALLAPTPHCWNRWVAEDELATGNWEDLLVEELDYGAADPREAILTPADPVVIEPFGMDAGFSAEDLAGRAFVLAPETLSECSGLGPSVAEALAGPLWLQVVSSGGGEAHFRLLQQLGSGERDGCVYLDDVASLSATGALRWEAEHLPLATEPEVQAWNLSILAGFDAAGERAAGVELTALVDLVAVTARTAWQPDTAAPLTWVELCETFALVGNPCEVCPGGDQASCAWLRFYGAQAAAETLPLDAAALAPCLVDLGEELPGCGSGCATAGGPRTVTLLLGAASLLLRRRRVRGQPHADAVARGCTPLQATPAGGR